MSETNHNTEAASAKQDATVRHVGEGDHAIVWIPVQEPSEHFAARGKTFGHAVSELFREFLMRYDALPDEIYENIARIDPEGEHQEQFARRYDFSTPEDNYSIHYARLTPDEDKTDLLDRANANLI